MINNLVSDVMLELHVPDFEPVKEFYLPLGFEQVWQKEYDGGKGYLVLRKGRSILNFWGNTDTVYSHEYFKRFPKDTPKGYGVEIIIPIDGIEDFYASFMNTNRVSVVEPLNHVHSHADFRAVDPFGYYLRFVERYNWVDGRDMNGKVLE